MQVTDNAGFRHRLAGLAEVFDVKLSPSRIALYFEALRDLEFAAIVGALNQAVKVCKFFPKPAEIRALALGDAEDRAEMAWMWLRKAMKFIGGHASISIHDAALAETVIAMFGSWSNACAQEFSPEMWASKRKEFGRVYRVICGRNLEGARYLPGTCEIANGGRLDWMKFVPVHRLDASGISSRLSLDAAEDERQSLAVVSHGLTQLRDLAPSVQRLVAGALHETA